MSRPRITRRFRGTTHLLVYGDFKKGSILQLGANTRVVVVKRYRKTWVKSILLFFGFKVITEGYKVESLKNNFLWQEK